MSDKLFLYLVNGEKHGKGFWKISLTTFSDPLEEDSLFIECYRKELLGTEAAKKILNAIELNIENLINDCRDDGYKIISVDEGISYDIPLTILEEIYDFWLYLYQDNKLFKKIFSLLLARERIKFSDPAMVKALKGFTGEWAQQIERLHSYRPSSKRAVFHRDPMWSENISDQLETLKNK